ncbi:MAG: hypothetical protein HY712_04225 [candidate division NC10 bacterium]|nr:hypothetical protein [candidate division NC10 bacterium]
MAEKRQPFTATPSVVARRLQRKREGKIIKGQAALVIRVVEWVPPGC